MSRRTKRIIIVVAISQFLIALGIFLLPQMVNAMPTRYQLAVQERFPASVGIFEAVTTPIPDLPAAEVAIEAIVIPTLAFEPVPTEAPTQTPTAEPTDQPAEVGEQPAEATAVPLPTIMPTETPAPTATNTPVPLPVRARLDGVVNIPQGFNNCGPANMTIVLNFHGNETTQSEAATYLKPNPEDRNVSPWQLRDYVNDFTGMSSSAHSGGDLQMIKRIIAAGYPVIVEKGYDPNSTEGWYGHYLTVFGYDDETQIFNAMDTYLGPFTLEGSVESYADMEEFWRHFNYTFVVIYPTEDEAIVQDLLGPEMVDSRTMWQNAALKAQADLEKNPDDAFAWFNLGTNLTRLGNYPGRINSTSTAPPLLIQLARWGCPTGCFGISSGLILPT